VVVEALGLGQGLESLIERPDTHVINYEPSVTLTLDSTLRLQARLSVETRTSAYQLRTGEYEEDQISVYFTVRQYWGNGPELSFIDSFRRQLALGEQIVRDSVIPRIIQPLAQVIASR
jgi:hypothetical protein